MLFFLSPSLSTDLYRTYFSILDSRSVHVETL
jgi:hypothetical protein